MASQNRLSALRWSKNGFTEAPPWSDWRCQWWQTRTSWSSHWLGLVGFGWAIFPGNLGNLGVLPCSNMRPAEGGFRIDSGKTTTWDLQQWAIERKNISCIIMYISNSSPGHVSSTKGEVVPPLSTFFRGSKWSKAWSAQFIPGCFEGKPTENDQKSTSQLHVPGYQLGGLDPLPAPCPGSVRLEQNPRDIAGIMANPRFIENDTGLFQYKECFFSMLFLAIYGKSCSINYRSHIKQIKKNMECHNLDSNTFFFTIYVSIGSRQTCSEATLC